MVGFPHPGNIYSGIIPLYPSFAPRTYLGSMHVVTSSMALMGATPLRVSDWMMTWPDLYPRCLLPTVSWTALTLPRPSCFPPCTDQDDL